jgi:hypothetical protein
MDTSPPPSNDHLAAVTQLMAEKTALSKRKTSLSFPKIDCGGELYRVLQEKNDRVEESVAKCTTASSRPREAQIQVLREEVRLLGRSEGGTEESTTGCTRYGQRHRRR